MNAARYVPVLALGLLAARPAARNDPSEIATRFLPPGGETAEIYRVNTKTATVTERTPAILRAHIVSANSNDLVLAYYSPGSPPATDKSLFVDLLHEGQSGYVKVWEGTYYGHILIVPDALRLLKLPGEERDAVALVSGRGASLGGTLQVLRWDTTWGLVNIMPENGPAHGFSFTQEKGTLNVKISFEKYPGEKGVPPPVVFRWRDGTFVKARN